MPTIKRMLELIEYNLNDFIIDMKSGHCLGIPDPERERAQSSYSAEVAKCKNELEAAGIKRKP